jgi:hypothetical protein
MLERENFPILIVAGFLVGIVTLSAMTGQQGFREPCASHKITGKKNCQ